MGNKIIEAVSAVTSSSQLIIPDILELQFTIVNACVVGDPESKFNEWVLIDTGLENSAEFILKSTEKRFGTGSRPQAIVLTHGHFDHVGSVIRLANFWDVPVYIHHLEIPYITGKKDYPASDTTVDGGIVAKMSATYPRTSINLGYRAIELPPDGSIPCMPGWKWIHTPGHTEGHISLFREKDRVLIVGDAFCTIKQESLLSVLTQKEQISGPPKYLTMNWEEAEKSVKRLQELKPLLALPSHGKPLKGKELARHLELLTQRFKDISKPGNSRYVDKY
ncbi:MBL fold metallo-hydrolase [Clostridium algoriphilum]|uniref:MBL fold metallo-hydrolase n=1 Tax=Clostridium algoriphilum TaxID=198347 RepID=UPI001CF59DB8|nr:MBL fold metallo-hydrolase [Clostridium algoriphilum]MCB2295478.1 MBL fold metallo-hydrolase [Clostridium algoriphilum]